MPTSAWRSWSLADRARRGARDADRLDGGAARRPAPPGAGARRASALLLAALAVAGAGRVGRRGGAGAGVGADAGAAARARGRWSGSAWASSRRPPFAPPRSPGASATRCAGANIAEILVPTAEERASPLGVALPAAGDGRLPADRRRPAPLRGAPRQLPRRCRSAAASTPARPRRAAGGRRSPRRRASSPRAWRWRRRSIVALWLTDLALGLVARAAPQVPVYFIGLPPRACWPSGVVLVGLGALEHALRARAGRLDGPRAALASRPGGDD